MCLKKELTNEKTALKFVSCYRKSKMWETLHWGGKQRNDLPKTSALSIELLTLRCCCVSTETIKSALPRIDPFIIEFSQLPVEAGIVGRCSSLRIYFMNTGTLNK